MSDYYEEFMDSRKALSVTENTMIFYRNKLSRILKEIDPAKATRSELASFLLQFRNPGNRHAYYRVCRTFFNWLEEVHGIPNPMGHMKAPKLPRNILPTPTKEEVLVLIDAARNLRDKAIIALLVESGLRLSELAQIYPRHLDMERRIIRVKIKGQKEGYATFGDMTVRYLTQWQNEYSPSGEGSIWGIEKWGINSMLKRLEKRTGIKCNAHCFRRAFACLLRQSGVGELQIMDLGRWETMDMVQLYTRSIGFKDSMKFYKGPLSE